MPRKPPEKPRSGRKRPVIEAGDRFRPPPPAEELLEKGAAEVFARIDHDLERVAAPMRPILQFIRANLFDPEIDVTEIRYTLGLRSNDVTTAFKHQTGETIGRYLEARRLQCACNLLVGTALDLEQIAALVGYRRLPTFSRAFQRRLGCRPQLYGESAGRRSRQAAVPPPRPEPPREAPASPAASEEAARRAPEPRESPPRPAPGPPRFLLGLAAMSPGTRCARCGAELGNREAPRVYEDFEPICRPCALEHAPRTLAELLSGAGGPPEEPERKPRPPLPFPDRSDG